MNRDDIIRMAREAGGDDWGIFKDFMPELEHFASLVAAAEREACAEVCDQFAANAFNNEDFLYEQAAAAIRARGNVKEEV